MNTNTTEKITINANTADLGLIDLLVDEGFYATRTEFIKTAIKAQLNTHSADKQRLIDTKSKSGDDWYMGVGAISLAELETLKKRGKTKKITAVGLLVIDKDIPLNLLKDTVTSIKVYGVCRCTPEVRAAYGL